MLKTYDVTCRDCGEDLEVDLDPETEEDCIECPNCFHQFDWYHDPATDTITLRADEYDEDDDILMDDDEEEDG